MSLTTALLILAWVPAAPGPARVVAGGAHTPGSPLPSALVTAPAKGGLELLTTGRCLLRLAPGASLRLESIAPGTTCPRVRLLKGHVRIVAPAKRSLHVLLGRHTMAVRGDVEARRANVSNFCAHSGSVRQVLAPRPPPVAAPSKKRRPVVASKGQCLWVTPAGIGASPYAPEIAAAEHRSTGTLYDFASPTTPVRFDLNKDVARASARIRSGKGGSGEVETGSQSMCLDSGSDGSAADLGSSVDVTKPPPPTQLRIRITLNRRSP